MANCEYPTKSVSVVVIMLASGILMIHGGSISSVLVQKQETQPSSSITKSLGMINLPQVPEFPKLGGRPGKNPSVPHSAPATNHNSQHANQQQQHYSEHTQQQTTVQEVQNAKPAYIAPVAVPQQEMEHVIYDTSLPDSDEDHREESQEDYVNEAYHESNVGEIEPTYQHYEQSAYTSIKNEESSVSKHAGSDDDDDDIRIPLQPEKSQDAIPDFPMPMHVMNILSALGSGGSLAQATKPEKDGVGQGYTTANAIGYATGDNATVTASVSNKMELNTATVILTESASASASSMSNGTAFSQATLQSNGYTSQYGPGGSGWKSNNKNPALPVFL